MTEAQSLLLLLGSGSALVSLSLTSRQRDQRRRDSDRVRLELRFPVDLTSGQAAEAAAQVAGAHTLAHRGLGGIDTTVVEVEGTAERIRHWLTVPRKQVDELLHHLHVAIPGLRLEADTAWERTRPTAALELRLTNWWRPLRHDDPAATSRAVLAALGPLHEGETVLVQWLLVPATARPVPSRTSKSSVARTLLPDITYQLHGSDDIRTARAKQAAPLYWVTLRVGAVAANRRRALQLAGGVVAALSMTAVPGVRFQRRRLPGRWTRTALMRGSTPLASFPILLNRDELVGLLGWPLDSPVVPGLEVVRGRRLAPAAVIPTHGRVIARSNYPGQERLLAQASASLLFHTWAVGPTGSGKSYLLTRLIAQDMAAPGRRSVVVVDAKADLVSAVLDHVPRDREQDVVLIDGTSGRPVGLNPLARRAQPVEVVADQIFGVLRRLWLLESAPRTADLLHVAILTLAHAPGLTLVELLPLLVNPAFRREHTARHANDPIIGPFWAAFEAMSAGERAQVIAPTLTRLRQLLLRSSVRTVLGQAEPSISIADAINSGKIVLVSLAAGRMGSESAALLGAVVLAELWLATQARANLAPDRRRLTSVYVDEFQIVSHLPTDLTEVLAQSRGFGVGYTLANQSPTQLPKALREAVSTNCRTKIAFATSAADAASLAKDFGETVTAADIQGLGRYEVMAAVATGSVAAPAATGVTLPLPEPSGRAEVVRQGAAERYGQDRDAVEAAIRQRLGQAAEPSASGRKRRQA